MSERIAHAAILRKDNCIAYGRDHASIIQASPPKTTETRGQGFLTNKMRFVKRAEAAKIAFDAGQIPDWKPNQILLSEELWGRGGIFYYDEQSGYMRNYMDKVND